MVWQEEPLCLYLTNLCWGMCRNSTEGTSPSLWNIHVAVLSSESIHTAASWIWLCHTAGMMDEERLHTWTQPLFPYPEAVQLRKIISFYWLYKLACGNQEDLNSNVDSLLFSTLHISGNSLSNCSWETVPYFWVTNLLFDDMAIISVYVTFREQKRAEL